jgi:phosphodiesterase/alkaline phosphatase D-like protein
MATNPDFNLFVGDFIYADHPYYASKTSEYFREKYRNVIGDPGMRTFLTRVPSKFMFDDHEFDDNWAGGNQDVRSWTMKFRPKMAKMKSQILHVLKITLQNRIT